MRITKTGRRAVTDDYLDLVRRFPLRPLRDDGEKDEAVLILSELVGGSGSRLSSGEREYADALGCFIREHDARHYPIRRRKIAPLQLVKSLMEDHSMSVSSLGKILGSATAASLFLAGKRELSKNHIRELAAYFKIEPGAFF
jgi:HTH-type transcriptional regulator/antitoxin HigA